MRGRNNHSQLTASGVCCTAIQRNAALWGRNLGTGAVGGAVLQIVDSSVQRL